MSDDLSGNPPVSFYIIAAVFLIWNLIGVMFYYMQMTMTPEIMADNFTPEQVTFMTAIPVWATAAYATAVNAGVVAAILLLLRKAWAVPAFIVSFAAVLIQDFDAFVLTDAIGIWGISGIYLPLVVIVICISEIMYSRSAKAKGWIA